MNLRIITLSAMALILNTTLSLAQDGQMPKNWVTTPPPYTTQQLPKSGEQSSQQSQLQQSDVALNLKVQVQVSEVLATLGTRPLTNANFALAVGTTIPASLLIQPLPVSLAKIMPQFEGRSFIRLSDQLVIIDPRSRQIIALIPVSMGWTARAQAAAPASTSQAPEFRQEELSTVRRSVPARRNSDNVDPNGGVLLR